MFRLIAHDIDGNFISDSQHLTIGTARRAFVRLGLAFNPAVNNCWIEIFGMTVAELNG